MNCPLQSSRVLLFHHTQRPPHSNLQSKISKFRNSGILSCMISRIFRAVLLLASTTALVPAKAPPQAARQWHTAHRQQILDEFTTPLAIPNVASDTANIQRNAGTL